ncbi:MAG: hypothetical protein ACOC9E_00970 [Chloroflexota bacterium]
MNNRLKQTLPALVAGALLVLVACAAPSEEPGAQETSPAQVTTAPVTPATVDMDDVTEDVSEQEMTREMPEELPAPGIPDPEAYMTEQARLVLADRLGVDVETISVVSVEAREWSDAALGCPEPGQMYAQVLTPGFQITLAVDDDTYTYHSDRNSALVLCGADGQPLERSEISGAGEDAHALKEVTPAIVDLDDATPNTPPDEDAPREIPAPGVPNSSSVVANDAAHRLANDLGIDVDNVKIVSVQQVEWNDSSLGCPRPGQNYLMVITPGYRIVLEANGEQFEFHSDMQGNMVQCRGEPPNGGVVR